jgi:hypothetical protein
VPESFGRMQVPLGKESPARPYSDASELGGRVN